MMQGTLVFREPYSDKEQQVIDFVKDCLKKNVDPRFNFLGKKAQVINACYINAAYFKGYQIGYRALDAVTE